MDTMRNDAEDSFSPKVAIAYFSPTGTTEKVVENIANGLSEKVHWRFNLTFPSTRIDFLNFLAEDNKEIDYWLFGIPVYGGYIPPLIAELIQKISIHDQKAISCVVYGNNEIGKALNQLTKLLEESGFSIIAAGAFIGEHSFSSLFRIAIGRPDQEDLLKAKEFGESILAKNDPNKTISSKNIDDKMSFSAKILPKKGPHPVVDHSRCKKCLTCVEHCPMGILDSNTIEYINKKAEKLCIGCMSCVKRCPENARTFNIPTPMQKILHKVFTEAKTIRHEPLLLL